jgi:hypothetical protein
MALRLYVVDKMMDERSLWSAGAAACPEVTAATITDYSPAATASHSHAPALCPEW